MKGYQEETATFDQDRYDLASRPWQHHAGWLALSFMGCSWHFFTDAGSSLGAQLTGEAWLCSVTPSTESLGDGLASNKMNSKLSITLSSPSLSNLFPLLLSISKGLTGVPHWSSKITSHKRPCQVSVGSSICHVLLSERHRDHQGITKL